MGSTGSVTATADGTWSAAFNDDYRGDNNGSFTLKVPAPTVTFTNYDLCAGFDDWTEFQTGGDNKVWVSVPQSGTNTVRALITPADQGQTISFDTDNPAIATVMPTNAASANQELTITGVAVGDTKINAKFLGQTIASFHVDVLPVQMNVPVKISYVTDTATNAPSPPGLLGQAVVENALARVYNKQACVYFDVATPDNCTTAYDINTNQMLDVDWDYDISAEESALGYGCCPENLYQKAIFIFGLYRLAANPAQPNDEVFGLGRWFQRWAYINTSTVGTGGLRNEVIAHEIGHTLHLDDIFGPDDRLMATNHFPQGAASRLTRDEWRAANNNAKQILE